MNGETSLALPFAQAQRGVSYGGLVSNSRFAGNLAGSP